MRPLPAAQATVASLHALLPPHNPTSTDEQFVIDAINALRHWAIPDQRPVPTRLRLRRSLPLRIRVSPPRSEASSGFKRGKRRNFRSRTGRRSGNVEHALSRDAQLSRVGKPSAVNDNFDQGVSQPLSLSTPDSQAINFSDLSTEPPEGWPKLSNVSSPVLEPGTSLPESGKDLDNDANFSATPTVAKRRKPSSDADSPVVNEQSVEAGSRKDSPQNDSIASTPAKSVVKRRRVSPRTGNKAGDAEVTKPDSEAVAATSASPGSTRGADSPAHSPGMKESGRDDEDHVKNVVVRKKSAKKRKIGDPKRRRRTSTDYNMDPITRGADSPPHSIDMKEPDRDDEDHVQSAHSLDMKQPGRDDHDHLRSVHVCKKSSKKRKSGVPKRRRPTPADQSMEPPFITEDGDGAVGETMGFAESPPPDFADEPPADTRFAKLVQSELHTESPPTSVTQKSREQGTDSHSDKSDGPAHSLGSVVVGTPSYDGCSVDMGHGVARAKRDDVPSRPSSVMWNESNAESIEEPPTGDQSAPLFDPIEETEKAPHSWLPQSSDKSHHPESDPDQDISNASPVVVKKGHCGDKSNFRNEDVTPTKLHKDPGKHLALSESKNSSISPLLPNPGKRGHRSNMQASTLSTSRQNDGDHEGANRQLPSRISPVSLEERPADGEKYADTWQQDKANYPSETSVGEMVVCTATFTKEIESELAQELVMRLGGEIVTDFESSQPECVVAPIDPQTKEVVSREMVILFALASRVPVVGLSWLTQCFKSGCWVDFKGFETPSSRLKPSSDVFRGVAATFEDAFSRKNAKKRCREYRDGISKLIILAGGEVVDKSKIAEATRNDCRIKLHLLIAYDFENDGLNTAPKPVPGGQIPMRAVNKNWISACLFSGQCPPP